MGLFKWLQKKGSLGSLVRWVYTTYDKIKKGAPELKEDDILESIFVMRYQSTRHLFNGESRMALDNLMIAIDKQNHKFGSLLSLIEACVKIEMKIYVSDGPLFHSTMDSVKAILHDLNKKNGTSYSTTYG